MGKVLIVIPARLASTRLPNKPLAVIGGMPMVVQVMRRAQEAALGEVIVACDGQPIASAVEQAGGRAVVTDPALPSGSDRVWAACRSIQDSGFRIQGEDDIIVNLQGDLPTLEPRLLRELLKPLENPEVDIATLVAPITDAAERDNPSVVKAVISGVSSQASGVSGEIGRALYFTRAAAPWGEGVRYHHIGVYAYRREALEKFVGLPPSPLEQREKLEQLRALEAGMRIDAVVVDTVPLGVDTEADLEKARKILVSGES